MQEAHNQQLAAGQASRNQLYEIQGAEQSRAMRARMSETELAMAMQEQAAANQAKREAIASAVGGAVNLGIGLSTGAVSDFKKQFGIGQGGNVANAVSAEAATKNTWDYQMDMTGRGFLSREMGDGRYVYGGATSLAGGPIVKHGSMISHGYEPGIGWGRSYDVTEMEGLDLSYLGADYNNKNK